MKRSTVRGFTLVELLVVIAIISLLSTIIGSSINNARKKARDSKRIADLKVINQALDAYYIDHGTYPPSACGYDCNGYYYSYVSSGWNTLASYLVPNYLSSMPKDPINSNCPPWGTKCYSYAYGNVGKDTYAPQYDLTTQLEESSNENTCGHQNYKFYFNLAPWCTSFGGSYPDQIYEASAF